MREKEDLKFYRKLMKHMKQYLLTTLFNAPVTIDSYYRSMVCEYSLGVFP